MIIDQYNIRKWYNKEGALHRDDGPAVVYPSGLEKWYQNGKRHREDGPAIVGYFGRIEWYLDGLEYSFTQWADKLDLDPKTRLELAMKWNRK